MAKLSQGVEGEKVLPFAFKPSVCESDKVYLELVKSTVKLLFPTLKKIPN